MNTHNSILLSSLFHTYFVQISSFEVVLQLEGAAAEGSLGAAGPVSAVFIRAPAILEVSIFLLLLSVSDNNKQKVQAQ